LPRPDSDIGPPCQSELQQLRRHPLR
jgi:hypothetical protein